MVHFPGFARARLWIHRAVRGFYPRGFPHSEIPGSKPACGSPRLIAACHVLLRLLLPRHPPCALSSLTTKFTQHTAALFRSQSHCHPERSMISREARKHAKSSDLVFDFSQATTRRLNSMGLLILLLARLLQLQRFTVLPSQGQPRDLETGNSETSCYVHQQGSFRHS